MARSGVRQADIRRFLTTAVLSLTLLLGGWPLRQAAAQSRITLSPTTVPSSPLGVTYSVQLTAQGGTAPYQFRPIQGPMPPGLTLSAGGLISGTTFRIGTFPFVVEVRDAVGGLNAFAFELRVDPPAGFGLSPSSLPQGMAGIRYAQPVEAFGGTAPYTLALTGRLPTGMTLDPVAGFDGTPLEAGSFPLTLAATDATSATTVRDYVLVVVPPAIALYPTLPTAVLGTPFSYLIGHNGGLGPFTHTISAGALPSGMSLNAANGTLSGTPTQAGVFHFDITITDSTIGTPGTDTESYELIVEDPALSLDPPTLPDAVQGQPYSVQLALTGGTGAVTFAMDATGTPPGTLPPGLQLAADGLLSGTPTLPGTYDFILRGTDAGGAFARRSYRIVVAPLPLSISPPSLPGGRVGEPYRDTIAATGGTGPYTYRFSWLYRLGMWVGGLQLPTGMTTVEPVVNGVATSAGGITLTGTPTIPGSFPIMVEVSGATPAGGAGLVVYTLVIAPAQLTLGQAEGALPLAKLGAAYLLSFAAGGGIAPYTYSFTGTLPPGLAFDPATGTLSGTPTTVGQYAFSITVADATPGTPVQVTRAYTLSVSNVSFVIGPATLPDAYLGVPYAQALSATGGTAPYAYAMTGTLPAGMTLAADGTLSGTPSEGGSFAFTVTATDAQALSDSRDFTLTVVARPDPSRDPEVIGLVQAQAAATRRFGNAQTTNFMQRMERLHGADATGGFDGGFAVSAQADCRDAVAGVADRGCGPWPSIAREAASERDASSHGDAARPFGLWVAGAVRSGDRDAHDGGAQTSFETDGVSLGVDRRVSDALTFGGGLGYGRDVTDVGDRDSHGTGRAYTLALYGSLHPSRRWFVDALFGYQSLRYTLRRHVTATDGEVRGERDGVQWFGALSLGADLRTGDWQFTPYLRTDLARGRLDAYAERGDPAFALHYAAMDVDTDTGNLGLRIDYRRQTVHGLVAPQLRLEYQHDFSGIGAQALRYADLPTGPLYRVELGDFDRSRWELGLGLLFAPDDAWAFRIGYRGLIDGDRRDGSVQVSVDRTF